MDTPLAVIGGGNMGKAIVAGAVKSALVNPEWCVVAEPDQARRSDLARLGVRTAVTSDEAMRDMSSWELSGVRGQVLLAVKPQSLGELAKEVGHLLTGSDRIVISVLAGTPSRKIFKEFGGGIRVVRAMPNLPALIGQAATAVCLGEGAMAGDEAFAQTLFRGLGPVVLQTREDLMDSATAVAGSGPAYVFYLAEAMEEAAVKLGFSPEEARRLVRQTIIGATAMMAESSDAPAELRAMVTSKGGTTAAACETLDTLQVRQAVVRAIEAAHARGRELGG
ncbi:MAG: pyrroline-5-carboxylate reductase [Phycisphaerales bacterium]